MLGAHQGGAHAQLCAHPQQGGSAKRCAACVQLQKILAQIKDRTESGKFLYTRFFAIGLFRMLELTKARDPKALEGLVSVRPPSLSAVRSRTLLRQHVVMPVRVVKSAPCAKMFQPSPVLCLVEPSFRSGSLRCDSHLAHMAHHNDKR